MPSGWTAQNSAFPDDHLAFHPHSPTSGHQKRATRYTDKPFNFLLTFSRQIGQMLGPTGPRLVARAAAQVDLRLGLPSLFPFGLQARSCGSVASPSRSKLSLLRTGPLLVQPWASASLRAAAFQHRAFHRSLPSAVIRDSYFQDDRRRFNSRHGGRRDRIEPPDNIWEKLRQAFWKAVLRFERLSPTTVLALVIAPNVLVYLGWWGADFFRVPRLKRFMAENFVLTDGRRWWTFFTNSISHEMLLHLGLNMFVLYNVGRMAVIPTIGNVRFLTLCAASAFGGSLFTYATHPPNSGTLGASGAISGLLAFTACAFPKQQVYMLFVLPMQLQYALGAWAAYEVFAELYWPNSRQVDGAAHLGGMATGALYFFLLRRFYKGW